MTLQAAACLVAAPAPGVRLRRASTTRTRRTPSCSPGQSAVRVWHGPPPRAPFRRYSLRLERSNDLYFDLNQTAFRGVLRSDSNCIDSRALNVLKMSVA